MHRAKDYQSMILKRIHPPVTDISLLVKDINHCMVLDETVNISYEKPYLNLLEAGGTISGQGFRRV